MGSWASRPHVEGENLDALEKLLIRFDCGVKTYDIRLPLCDSESRNLLAVFLREVVTIAYDKHVHVDTLYIRPVAGRFVTADNRLFAGEFLREVWGHFVDNNYAQRPLLVRTLDVQLDSVSFELLESRIIRFLAMIGVFVLQHRFQVPAKIQAFRGALFQQRVECLNRGRHGLQDSTVSVLHVARYPPYPLGTVPQEVEEEPSVTIFSASFIPPSSAVRIMHAGIENKPALDQHEYRQAWLCQMQCSLYNLLMGAHNLRRRLVIVNMLADWNPPTRDIYALPEFLGVAKVFINLTDNSEWRQDAAVSHRFVARTGAEDRAACLNWHVAHHYMIIGGPTETETGIVAAAA